MNFDNENTYEEFFDKMHSAEGTRNLRQIFEDDDKPLQSESNNLRYQPNSSHKQTQHTEQNHKSKPHSSGTRKKPMDTKAIDTWTTVVAKVANGFKGSDHVGRVGVALSRNGAGATKLVIYKSRNHLLTTLLMTKSITSPSPRDGAPNLILRESYMQFYDDDQQFWSLRFEATSDEEEFTEALLSLGLPMELMNNEEEAKESKSCTVSTNTSPTVLSRSSFKPVPPSQTQARPKPKLRQKSEAPADDNDAASSLDSESESTQSTEDNQTQRAAIPITKALVPIATSTSLMSSDIQPDSRRNNKLETYLDEQRATGQAMDKKMDTILQAMCRLTNGSHMQFSEADSAAEQKQDVKKMDSMLLQAMGRLKNSSAMQLNDSINTANLSNDNEDEMLELEQKLLDFKKQNRILIKNLKVREQALAELRASTCALCEELLSQNSDLKKQNTALVTAMSSQMSAESSAASLSTTTSCANCDKYISKINALERRVSVLQSALLNFPNIGSASTSAASMKATSPP